MTAMDVCGVLVLAYATCVSVWTLLERDTAAKLRALLADDDRPSALPRVRCAGGDAA